MISVINYKNNHNKLSSEIKQQLLFFLPIAATTLLISVTHSLFNAGAARLPEPEIYLSAFSVAKGVFFLFQCPLVMVRNAVIALADTRDNYIKIGKYMFGVFCFMVGLVLMFKFTGLLNVLFEDVMGLSGKILEEAQKIFIYLCFILAAVLVREYLMGLAVKIKATFLLTCSTIVRIVYVLLIITNIDKLASLPTGLVISSMFIGGIYIEAIFMFIGIKILQSKDYHRLVEWRSNKPQPSNSINGRYFAKFYTPLVLTSFIVTVVLPIINSGLARTVSPELAISAFAVARELTNMLTSPVNTLYQLSLTFMDKDKRKQNKATVIIGVMTTMIVTGIFILIAFSNLGYYIFNTIIGVNNQITKAALDVIKVMIAFPIIVLFKQLSWGILLKERKTVNLSIAEGINIAAIIAVTILLTLVKIPNPAVKGAIAFVSGVLCQSIYLFIAVKRHTFLENKSVYVEA